ncbi:unnamed protein product, partial [marine sediment metagenome]
LPVCAMFYIAFCNIPIEKEEIKKSIDYIENNIETHDAVYVYYGSSAPFQFYREINYVDIDNKIIFGTSHRGDFKKYYYELLNLRGRVWLLFSHIFPFSGNVKESDYMIDFLIRNGSELLDKKRYKGSIVYYVDTKKTNRD